MSVLTSSPNAGKVAWRDALVKEVCWLTGTTSESRIPSSMRRQPGQFFAMWEQCRGKAQKLISLNKKKDAPASLLTLEAADDQVKLEPGLSEASGTSAHSAGNDKFMLASLLENDKIVKSKRIIVPHSLADLKKFAIDTFHLPQDSDLAFELLDATTQDMHDSMHHVVCIEVCVLKCGLVVLNLCFTLCFWLVWFGLIVLSNWRIDNLKQILKQVS